MKSLEEYGKLLKRVDEFCATVTVRYPEQVACRRGCDACCTHIGVMAVEAVSLARAAARLGGAKADHIREWARNAGSDDPCPLLEGGVCLLYDARPVICRTHGLPLLLEEDGVRRVDCCPLNFQGVESLPGDAVLNLETLNQALSAINLLCLREPEAAGFAERFSIAQALLLEVDEIP